MTQGPSLFGENQARQICTLARAAQQYMKRIQRGVVVRFIARLHIIEVRACLKASAKRFPIVRAEQESAIRFQRVIKAFHQRSTSPQAKAPGRSARCTDQLSDADNGRNLIGCQPSFLKVYV